MHYTVWGNLRQECGTAVGAIQTEVVFSSSLCKGRLGGICGIMKYSRIKVCDGPNPPRSPFPKGGSKTNHVSHQFEIAPVLRCVANTVPGRCQPIARGQGRGRARN